MMSVYRTLRRCRFRGKVPIIFCIIMMCVALVTFQNHLAYDSGRLKSPTELFVREEHFMPTHSRKGLVSSIIRSTTTVSAVKDDDEIVVITLEDSLKMGRKTTHKPQLISILKPMVDKIHDHNGQDTHAKSHGDQKDSFLNFDPAKFKSIKHNLYHNTSKPVSEFLLWENNSLITCGGTFVLYNNEFAFARDIIIDRSASIGRDGGESIEDVINQDEMVEYHTINPGFMKLHCNHPPRNYSFNLINHMNEWIKNLGPYEEPVRDVTVYDKPTFAVTRYEYVNIYHTMTDFYNVFLMMEFFKVKQEDVNVLLIDGHPKGSLDSVWSTLFNSTCRISSLPANSKFKTLVWVMQGYNSPLLQHSLPSIPLVEEFREFFLRSFDIKDIYKLNCDKMKIMFIWRHNYIAHPRNPKGVVSRKIANEHELVESLHKNLPPGFRVLGRQIDKFTMRQQLLIIRETDILIGMHGAGLTHGLFLPKHAGLIELVPNYWSPSLGHFESIATWRKLKYAKWVNNDPRNELEDQNTRIPPDVLNVIVKRMIQEICPGTKGIKNFFRQQMAPEPTQSGSTPKSKLLAEAQQPIKHVQTAPKSD